MAYKANLTVAGLEELPVYEFSLTLHQAMDNRGRPASGVFTGDIFLIVEGGDDTFFEWLCEATRTESGKIKTIDDAGSTLVEYSFESAFITDVNESFIDDSMGVRNEFNLISVEEDDNGNIAHRVANIIRGKDENFRPLLSAYDSARAFQRRTGNAYVTYFSLSCEKIRVRDVEHDNQWGKK
ncbi:hypothetical protein GCM10028805_20000 [Spirosoma harenae]